MKDKLLAAIHAALDDDAPRLVYADYLQQNGDPRGEFIAVQVKLARTRDDDPAFPALVRREAALWREHAFTTWLQEEARRVHSHPFARGFPYFAEVEYPSLSRVRKETPTVTGVAITKFGSFSTLSIGPFHELFLMVEKDPSAFLKSKRAAKLRALDLHVPDAAWIAKLPRCSRLATLVLSGDPRVPVTTKIARWPALATELESLSILYLDVPDKLPAIGARVFRLRGSPLGRARLGDLLSKLEAVEELQLHNCELDDGAIADLASWSGAKRVTRLDLSRNSIGPAAAEAIVKAFPALTRLRLRETNIGDDGVIAIAKSRLPATLVELCVGESDLGAKAAEAVAKAKWPRLVMLDFTGEVGQRGVSALTTTKSFDLAHAQMPYVVESFLDPETKLEKAMTKRFGAIDPTLTWQII